MYKQSIMIQIRKNWQLMSTKWQSQSPLASNATTSNGAMRCHFLAEITIRRKSRSKFEFVDTQLVVTKLPIPYEEINKKRFK